MSITIKRKQTVIQHLYSAVCKSTFFKSLTPELLWEPDGIVAFVSPGLHSTAELRVKVDNDGQLTMTLLKGTHRMTFNFDHAESFSAMDFDDFSAVVQDVLGIFNATLPPNDEDHFVRGED